ncbi:MAG: lipoate--protein ligase [Clostridia bacterium]|nr:lipoate--protein ligase [Clostridia bacterium]
MIYVDTGSRDPYFNFGAEYYFAAERDLGDPVFLLWSTEPTLMIGKYQDIYGEIDLPYARDHGINVVRRLSGGGTIYTDPGGFQYSFILRGGGESIDFDGFIEPVVAALRRLGIPAGRSGRNDILLGGRKISGNAQYKLRGATVHHGSLLFSTDIEEMTRASTPPDYKISSKSIRSVRDRVTNISEYPGVTLTAEEFPRALIGAMEEETGTMRTYRLTKDDRERIAALGDVHFRARDAIFSRAPKFDIEKTCRTPGGTVTVSFSVKDGAVAAAEATGDFFAADGSDAFSFLVGTPFEKEALREKIKNAPLSLWGVDAGELADAMTEGL